MENVDALMAGLVGSSRARSKRLPAEVERPCLALLAAVGWPHPGGEGLRTLGLTGSARGEGVTTVAAHLAAAAAASGHGEVLLVDANLWHPAAARLFRCRPWPGLADALHDGLRLADYLQPTETPNLCLLAAGRNGRGPTDAYLSPGLPHLVDRLRERFDLVVFDLPPVGRDGSAVQLARRLDGVLLVLEAGRARCEMAARAKQALARSNAPLLGAVLNKRAPLKPHSP